VSLRLWRAPQPYFKLRFCSLIAFGPDCSHFPSAIPNMRENGADLVSAVCEACRGQSRRQRRRHARHHCGPQGQPLAPLQPLRREARLDQAAWPTPDVGRARLSPGMPVCAPTNGRWDSLSQGESTTKDGAGGFPLAPWPKPASDWRERAGRKP
jgi:hypothetical protein